MTSDPAATAGHWVHTNGGVEREAQSPSGASGWSTRTLANLLATASAQASDLAQIALRLGTQRQQKNPYVGGDRLSSARTQRPRVGVRTVLAGRPPANREVPANTSIRGIGEFNGVATTPSPDRGARSTMLRQLPSRSSLDHAQERPVRTAPSIRQRSRSPA